MTMMHLHTIGPDVDGDLLEELEGRELGRPPIYHDADDPRVTALRAYWQGQPSTAVKRRGGTDITGNLMRSVLRRNVELDAQYNELARTAWELYQGGMVYDAACEAAGISPPAARKRQRAMGLREG